MMRVRTLVLPLLLLLSGCGVVSFPDPALESAVRTAIGKPTGDICGLDLLLLCSLDASSAQIQNLQGIENCIALTELWLDFNQITDITPLESLVNLSTLSLTGNQVVDVSPLACLTRLRRLSLSNNEIEDLAPIAQLSRLERLSVAENRLSALPDMSRLKDLAFLYADNNVLEDVSGLSQTLDIREIYVANNLLPDIDALLGMAELRALRIDGNPTPDVSEGLTAFPGLETLGVSDYQVSGLDALSGFASQLTRLVLRGPGFNNLSGLREFINLQVLRLEDSTVTDFLPLNELPHLTALGLARNGIQDLTPLSSLTRLTYVDLSGNAIMDISNLPAFEALGGIDLAGNQISDVTSLVDPAIQYGATLEPDFPSLFLLFDWNPLALSLPLPIVNILNNPLSESAACEVIQSLEDLGGTILTDLSCGGKGEGARRSFGYN